MDCTTTIDNTVYTIIHSLYFTLLLPSRGCHIFMITTRTMAHIDENIKVEIEANRESIRQEPYASIVRKAHILLLTYGITLGISRENYRGISTILFFSERETVSGTIASTWYPPLPIPAGGLKILLLLLFQCANKETIQKMKWFVTNLYNYNFVQRDTEGDEDEDEIVINIEEEDANAGHDNHARKNAEKEKIGDGEINTEEEDNSGEEIDSEHEESATDASQDYDENEIGDHDSNGNNDENYDNYFDTDETEIIVIED